MGRSAPARGGIRKLPSGRYQVRYVGPDGGRYHAPITFQTKLDASVWMAQTTAAISAGTWVSPAQQAAQQAAQPLTLREYADRWLTHRKVRGRPLAARTADTYRHELDQHVLPVLGDQPLNEITRVDVDRWYDGMDPKHATLRARTYSLLRTIFTTAIDDGLIEVNPAHVRGAGSAPRRPSSEVPTPAQLAVLVDKLPEHYHTMVWLTAWCALRFGEVTELRRGDVDLRRGVLHIRRGVVRVQTVPDELPPGVRVCSCRQGCLVGPPKSEAGVRDVAIPPHLTPLLRAHMLAGAAPGADGLVFPAPSDPTRHLNQSTLQRVFARARVAAGLPHLRVHDLRHAGLTWTAQTGATLAELMARAGHTTPATAMRYQHASAARDRKIAEDLSRMAGRHTG